MTERDAAMPGVTGLDAAAGTRVLVVDDEAGVRDLMARWIRAAGHEVVAAASAEEALAILDATSVTVAFCDIRMPGRDGLWLAEQIRLRSPDTAIVMATGVQDVGSAVTSLRHGVIDYLMKPFGRDRLREAVERGCEWHRTASAARQTRERLEAEVRVRRDHLTEALVAVSPASRDALEDLLRFATLREPAMFGHSIRVADLAVRVGRHLHLPAERQAALEVAALVHDLLKLAMADAVLHSEGPLDEAAAAFMRELPAATAEVLETLPWLVPAAAIVRQLAERHDGTGYPSGLSGQDVALESRILAAVDAFDTMLLSRRYARARSGAESRAEMRLGAGTQFDPHVVEALLEVVGPA